MDIYNFAIIGCGRIAIQHAESIKSVSGLNLVAVSDINKKRAQEFSKKYNVQYLTNEEIYENKDINIVAICTPNNTHPEIGIKLANAKKHIVCEKPLAISIKKADELIKKCKEKKVKLFAVKQVRFNPAVQALKKNIKNLGKIYSASLVIRWTRPQEYFDNDEWRGTKKLDGGTLINQGIHYLDVLLWCLGPIESIIAKKDTLAHKIEIEDIALAVFKFRSGALGTLEFTINTYPKNMECSLTVLGENGTVKIGGTAMNEVVHWDVKGVPRPEIESIQGNVYDKGLYQGSCPNHKLVYQNIINYMNGKEDIIADGEEARKSLELVEAIYRSADHNKEIKL